MDKVLDIAKKLPQTKEKERSGYRIQKLSLNLAKVSSKWYADKKENSSENANKNGNNNSNTTPDTAPDTNSSQNNKVKTKSTKNKKNKANKDNSNSSTSNQNTTITTTNTSNDYNNNNDKNSYYDDCNDKTIESESENESSFIIAKLSMSE